ncbi:MAG TPA: DUF4743 domain-containing protein, partial [Gammaproteobacteria bacterium]|nr:DUF4743 domain-containing protein [Gammaproteobacteria bacterium]
MKYRDYIEQCNRHRLEEFTPLIYGRHRLGYLRKPFARMVTAWGELFRAAPGKVELIARGDGIDERSGPWNQMLRELVEQGVLEYLTGEPYPVTPAGRDQTLFVIDRAAAPLFGIRAFGQHINGYVRAADGLQLWVGKRSADRRNFPGKLDHLVAGGLPYAVSLEANLVKECWEEAGIPAALARRAVPTGVVTYVAESSRGLKPDTLYCYDLELPKDFRPRCTDGEVESFELWPVEQVMEVLQAGPSFKLNCNLVIIDFLIRHGYIDPEHEDYLQLVSGL